MLLLRTRARTAAPHCGSHCHQPRVLLTLHFLRQIYLRDDFPNLYPGPSSRNFKQALEARKASGPSFPTRVPSSTLLYGETGY